MHINVEMLYTFEHAIIWKGCDQHKAEGTLIEMAPMFEKGRSKVLGAEELDKRKRRTLLNLFEGEEEKHFVLYRSVRTWQLYWKNVPWDTA